MVLLSKINNVRNWVKSSVLKHVRKKRSCSSFQIINIFSIFIYRKLPSRWKDTCRALQEGCQTCKQMLEQGRNKYTQCTIFITAIKNYNTSHAGQYQNIYFIMVGWTISDYCLKLFRIIKWSNLLKRVWKNDSIFHNFYRWGTCSIGG